MTNKEQRLKQYKELLDTLEHMIIDIQDDELIDRAYDHLETFQENYPEIVEEYRFNLISKCVGYTCTPKTTNINKD